MSSKLSPADETFQSLMHGGAVNGLCVCAGPKVIRSRMPYSTHRIEGIAHLIDEAFQHQSKKGRRIDSFWFGLGTFNLLAVAHKGMRIIILHVRDEETDFLAQVGRLFLKDYGADFVESPEHKRLVTARILVTAPDSQSEAPPPLPANPATSRIPLSPRFIEHQMSAEDETTGGGAKPVIPKPIRRPSAESAAKSADGTPSIRAIPGEIPHSDTTKADSSWATYKDRLIQILERAVGAERAKAIISEKIEEFAGHPSKALPESWFKEFGDAVIEKIIERPLQDRARNELVATYRDFSI